MGLRGAAKLWWDSMFAPKGPRYVTRRNSQKNGARECERRRRQTVDEKFATGYWQQKALERAAARES